MFSNSLVAAVPVQAAPGLKISIALHILAGAAVVLGPMFWANELPPTEGVRAVLYNPPPPPPPPLSLGNPLAKVQPAQPVTPETTPRKPTPQADPAFVAPREEEPLQPENKLAANEQAGSLEGSAMGDPDGLLEGVEGGVVGGVPGGVLGGILGGTGEGLTDYDRPPQLLRQTRPVYPPDAFVKRIEGKVLVELIIDIDGRVLRAKVIESIPLLDDAATSCVRQWVFSPATKEGRPVRSIAQGLVTFRLL